MTPIEVIKNMNFCGLCTTGNCAECDRKIAKDEAINALEEVEQYRSIGTVKEIKIREAQAKRLSEGYLTNLGTLREYQSIGTPEECRAAVEKQRAKKVIDNMPTDDDVWYQCPTCKGDLTNIRGFHCPYCGQKLNWSDEE